jgi:hypothetical protein
MNKGNRAAARLFSEIAGLCGDCDHGNESLALDVIQKACIAVADHGDYARASEIIDAARDENGDFVLDEVQPS